MNDGMTKRIAARLRHGRDTAANRAARCLPQAAVVQYIDRSNGEGEDQKPKNTQQISNENRPQWPIPGSGTPS